MNKKLVLVGILLLVGLTLSGCVWYGGHGYGYDGYSHSDGYHNHGYERPYGNHRDWDGGHYNDSGRGSRHG